MRNRRLLPLILGCLLLSLFLLMALFPSCSPPMG